MRCAGSKYAGMTMQATAGFVDRGLDMAGAGLQAAGDVVGDVANVGERVFDKTLDTATHVGAQHL